MIHENIYNLIRHLIEYIPEFHPVDIIKIKEDNHWLQRFLEHNENNVQEALNMLWETCYWRSKFGTNGMGYTEFIFFLFSFLFVFNFLIFLYTCDNEIGHIGAI